MPARGIHLVPLIRYHSKIVPSAQTDYTTRYHGLDATRAIALLLGISLHATCSFVPGFSTWAVTDTQAGEAPASIVIALHIFRMATFFLLAGFFARLVIERKGTAAFRTDRLRRIAIPLAVGWLILFPIISAAYIWGAQRFGYSWLPPNFANVPIGRAGILSMIGALTGRRPFQLAHLWFLYYLLFYYAATLALQPLRSRLASSADAAIQVLAGRWWGILPGSLVLALFLGLGSEQSNTVLDVRFGLTNPDSLVPVPGTLIAYGIFYLAGWWLHGQPSLLESLRRRYTAYTAVFAVLAVGIVVAGTKLPSTALFFTLYAVAAWCGVFGMVGACLHWFSAPSRFWRYVSDASYWMYLIHLPAILFLQVAIANWQMHWVLKLLLIHAAVLPPLVGSYHFLVRPTAIGALLNGRKKAAVAAER